MQSRRALITSVGTAALLTLTPQISLAQGYFLPKLPWKPIINGIAIGLQIVIGYLGIPSSSDKPSGQSKPPICAVDLVRLGELDFRCRQFALSLNSRNYMPSEEEGDHGLVPALKAYIAKGKTVDRRDWLAVRNAVNSFLGAARGLVEEIIKERGIISFVEGQGKDALPSLYQALQGIENTINSLEYFEGAPTPQDVDGASLLLSYTDGLQQLSTRGLAAAEELKQRRDKASC